MLPLSLLLIINCHVHLYKMVAEGDSIIRYVITGLEERNERDRFRRYIVPEGVTHVSVHESVDVIPAAVL